MTIAIRSSRMPVLGAAFLGLAFTLSEGQRAPVSNTSAPVVPAVSLVFDGVTVVDVERGRLIPSQRVVIVGNRILTVGNTSAVPMPKQARIVDARGKYLIPGLWDMHTHSRQTSGNLSTLFLANGVTGIRNAASEWPLDSMVEWRRQVLAGTRVGPPRQLLSGHSIDERRSCQRTLALHTCISDSADAHHLIDSLKTAGADMLKTYSLSSRMYFIIAGEARRAGLPFGGHTKVSAMAASDSGAGIIDHSAVNEELMTRCLYHQASIEQCRPVAERFVRNNTWWVPTWVFPPHIAGGARSRSIYAHYEAFVRGFWSDSASYTSLYEHLRRAMINNDPPIPRSNSIMPVPSGGSTVDSLGYMYIVLRAGLPVMAGTDTDGREVVPGFSLHTELATYVAEGMTPLQALQTATLNPAKFLRGTDSLGTVAPGKLADLVLLDANPLENIVNTMAIRAVVANGRYFDRAELDRVLAEVRSESRH